MTKDEYESKRNKIKMTRFPIEHKKELLKELELEYNAHSNDEDIESILSKAVVGTIDNHYNDFAFGRGIATLIGNLFFQNYSNKQLADLFKVYISEKSFRYNVPLRSRVTDYYNKNKNENILLDLLKLLYSEVKDDTLKGLIDSIDVFVNPSIINNDRLKLIEAFSVIHRMLAESALGEGRVNHKYFKDLFYEYYSKKNVFEVFGSEFSSDSDIVIEEVTDTYYQFLSNADGYKLKDSFDGSLLHGNIQVSSDRGYKTHTSYPQQDAVGSMALDDSHFINIVADGVGGAELGHVASLELVNSLLNWYKSLSFDIMDDIDTINILLKKELNKINMGIIQKYNRSAQTTVVISITVSDKTLIANVGDSTAYGYDYENDKLIELTTLDSDSYGLSYEEARNNPFNNRLTQGIGCFSDIYIHTNLVDNNGQRIILSSDGITDLTNEERFKSYFRDNTPAKVMVSNAVNNPDETYYKIEDNVSAIAVNLPNEMVKRRGM